MLIGPITVPRNREKNGGAAGNRTRVQFAYYVGVYPHSRTEARQVQYRRLRPSGEETSEQNRPYRIFVTDA